jgi:hypothetical protein
LKRRDARGRRHLKLSKRLGSGNTKMIPERIILSSEAKIPSYSHHRAFKGCKMRVALW